MNKTVFVIDTTDKARRMTGSRNTPQPCWARRKISSLFFDVKLVSECSLLSRADKNIWLAATGKST